MSWVKHLLPAPIYTVLCALCALCGEICEELRHEQIYG
jgi:hypothetical protein